MIRITCPNCQSKLNAKEKLAGQTRKCPKCGTPLLIPDPDIPLEDPQSEAAEEPKPAAGAATLLSIAVPEQLDPTSRYLICDRTKVVALWRNDGRGWMLKTRQGLVGATRNRDQLPGRGNYVLVQVKLESGGDGLRLQGLVVCQLSPWAMASIEKGERKILETITDFTGLGREQKAAVRQFIMEQFMHGTWQDAKSVLEYLGNTDYHSPGVDV